MTTTTLGGLAGIEAALADLGATICTDETMVPSTWVQVGGVVEVLPQVDSNAPAEMSAIDCYAVDVRTPDPVGVVGVVAYSRAAYVPAIVRAVLAELEAAGE